MSASSYAVDNFQWLDRLESSASRWRSPELTPGDVRELVGVYRSILAMDLPVPMRRATEASLARTLGEGDPIPDVPTAAARWLAALITDEALEPEGPTVTTGRALLEEIIRSGEAHGWEALQASMSDLATFVATLRARPNAAPEGSAEGPLGEKGSAEGVDWYEPGSCPFYVLGGPHGQALRDLVTDLRAAPRYIEHQIDAPTRILFTGDPGDGKSLGARWVADQLGAVVALLRLDTIASSWKNRTPRNLRACFDAARGRGAVVVIDELDGLIGRRDKGDTDGSDKRTVGAVFQLFDSLPPEQIVICCTNLPEAIDPSMLRRLGTRIAFAHPDAAARRAIIEHAWRAMTETTDAAARRLVELTADRSGDTVRRVAHDAARRALRAERDEVLLDDVHAAMVATPREGRLEPASLLS